LFCQIFAVLHNSWEVVCFYVEYVCKLIAITHLFQSAMYNLIARNFNDDYDDDDDNKMYTFMYGAPKEAKSH